MTMSENHRKIQFKQLELLIYIEGFYVDMIYPEDDIHICLSSSLWNF